jgi:hypothetical protein
MQDDAEADVLVAPATDTNPMHRGATVLFDEKFVAVSPRLDKSPRRVWLIDIEADAPAFRALSGHPLDRAQQRSVLEVAHRAAVEERDRQVERAGHAEGSVLGIRVATSLAAIEALQALAVCQAGGLAITAATPQADPRVLAYHTALSNYSMWRALGQQRAATTPVDRAALQQLMDGHLRYRAQLDAVVDRRAATPA